jgi:UDP-N-acetylmuramate dehydrogenase
MSLLGSELRHALAGYRGALREQVSLAPMTHIRIGGAAQFLLEPSTEQDVSQIVRVARELDLPLHLLGGGSNLLIGEAGVPGLTVSLSTLNRVIRDGERITAGAGVTLPSLIRGTKDQGLAGLELLIGIPAVVGGAIAMNAGTRDTEVFDCLVSLTVVDEFGEIRVLDKEAFRPEYRDGGIAGKIVVQATFELRPESPKLIFERMENSLKRRNATQPVTERSVGCVFRNPEGGSAGNLIEQAGCKTMRRGKIVVSGKHANYFVNEGGGTSRDFLDLMHEVQERVAGQFGVALEPELKFWG